MDRKKTRKTGSKKDPTKSAMHYLHALESGEIPEIMHDYLTSQLTPEQELALEYARQFGQSGDDSRDTTA